MRARALETFFIFRFSFFFLSLSFEKLFRSLKKIPKSLGVAVCLILFSFFFFFFNRKPARTNERLGKTEERGREEGSSRTPEGRIESPGPYQLLQERQRANVHHLAAHLHQDVTENAENDAALAHRADNLAYLGGPLQQRSVQVRGTAVHGHGQREQMEHQDSQPLEELQLFIDEE